MLKMEPLISKPPIDPIGGTPGLLRVGGNRATSSFSDESMGEWLENASRLSWTGSLGVSLVAQNAQRSPLDPQTYGGARLDRSRPEPVYWIFVRGPQFEAEPAPTTDRGCATLVSAMLGLGKSDIARILGVSRPTLYAWLSGASEPLDGSHSELLRRLAGLVTSCCRGSSRPLYYRYVEEPLQDESRSIRDLLLLRPWDDSRIRRLLSEARRKTDERERGLRQLVGTTTSRQMGDSNFLDNLVAVDIR